MTDFQPCGRSDAGVLLLTFLLSLAENLCAPLAPQACAELGSDSEVVQAVRLQR